MLTTPVDESRADPGAATTVLTDSADWFPKSRINPTTVFGRLYLCANSNASRHDKPHFHGTKRGQHYVGAVVAVLTVSGLTLAVQTPVINIGTKLICRFMND